MKRVMCENGRRNIVFSRSFEAFLMSCLTLQVPKICRKPLSSLLGTFHAIGVCFALKVSWDSFMCFYWFVLT